MTRFARNDVIPKVPRGTLDITMNVSQLTPASSIKVPKAQAGQPDFYGRVRTAKARRTAAPIDRTLASAALAASGLCVGLEGTPRARPEPRGWKGSKRVVNAPAKIRRYIVALERNIREAMANVGGPEVVRATFGGLPIIVRIVWSFPTIKESRWGEYHLAKPDVDNLEKLVLDCLKRCGALGGDDCVVARVEKTKTWDMAGWLWVLVKPADERPTKAMAKAEALKLAPDWLRR